MKTAIATMMGFATLTTSLFSQTNVIDFQSLEAPGTGYAQAAQFYREKGFVFSSLNNFLGPFACWRTNDPHYDGSTALFDDYNEDYTCLARSDGGYFDFLGIDLAGQLGPAQETITFGGYNGPQVAGTFQAVLNGVSWIQTFSVPSFTNLTEVRWQQVSPGHQFDNVVVYSRSGTAPPPDIHLRPASTFSTTAPLDLLHLRVGTNYVVQKSFDLQSWKPSSSFQAFTTTSYDYSFIPFDPGAAFYRLAWLQ